MLCEASINDNTRSTYRTGFTIFCQFLSSIGIEARDYHPPEISEQILIYFVTHCCNMLKLSHSTIKLYLAAARFRYIKAGVPNPLLFVIRYLCEVTNSDERNSEANVHRREMKTHNIQIDVADLTLYKFFPD